MRSGVKCVISKDRSVYALLSFCLRGLSDYGRMPAMVNFTVTVSYILCNFDNSDKLFINQFPKLMQNHIKQVRSEAY